MQQKLEAYGMGGQKRRGGGSGLPCWKESENDILADDAGYDDMTMKTKMLVSVGGWLPRLERLERREVREVREVRVAKAPGRG